jgi:hypothetical protein
VVHCLSDAGPPILESPKLATCRCIHITFASASFCRGPLQRGPYLSCPRLGARTHAVRPVHTAVPRRTRLGTPYLYSPSTSPNRCSLDCCPLTTCGPLSLGCLAPAPRGPPFDIVGDTDCPFAASTPDLRYKGSQSRAIVKFTPARSDGPTSSSTPHILSLISRPHHTPPLTHPKT